MRGHYGHYGITGNARRLDPYCEAAKRFWHKWLGPRSNRRDLSWARFLRILQRYPLPPPRVVHSVYRAVHAVS
jgi:hypothetical protein